jgi:hypothetical protein
LLGKRRTSPIRGDLERSQLSLAEVIEEADDELLRVNRIRSAWKSKTGRKPGQRSPAVTADVNAEAPVGVRWSFDYRAARTDRPLWNPHDSFLSIRTEVVS